MSNKQQQQTKSGPEPILVKVLRLEDSRTLEVKGYTGFSSSQVMMAGENHRIEYRPWMRHHAILYMPGKENEETVMVPESWCSWEPL